MLILGIDPGTATTGYGVVDRKRGNKSFQYVSCGTIETKPSQTTPFRLNLIHKELSGIVKKHQPDILVMEKVFFFKNLKTIIPVSQAQGVILLVAAKKRVPVCQFTPLQVKMTITGYGRASKKEVEKKVQKMLKLKTLPSKSDDAMDALAIALTYCLKNVKEA